MPLTLVSWLVFIAPFCEYGLAPGLRVKEELDVRQISLGIRLRNLLTLALAWASLVQDRRHLGAVGILALPLV